MGLSSRGSEFGMQLRPKTGSLAKNFRLVPSLKTRERHGPQYGESIVGRCFFVFHLTNFKYSPSIRAYKKWSGLNLELSVSFSKQPNLKILTCIEKNKQKL